MNIHSVVKYIPNGEEDNSPFAGLLETATQRAGKKGVADANTRQKLFDTQRRDAEDRNVMWNIEDLDKCSDMDAEGSPDPDCRAVDDSGIGLLPSSLPFATEETEAGGDVTMESSHPGEFFGRIEQPPSRVGKLVSKCKR